MKKVLKYFTNKNSLLIFIMSLIVSLFSTITIMNSNIKINKEYSDYIGFPVNFSYLKGDSIINDDKVNMDFKDLNKTKIYKLNYKAKVNFEFKNRDIVIIGVDDSFINYPLLFQTKYASRKVIEKQQIDSGRCFNKSDMIGKTKTVIMNSSFLNEAGYNGKKIKIQDVDFDLIGSLSTTRMIDVYKDDSNTIIPIYVPYTTLKELFPNESMYSYEWIIETNGFRFKDYEHDNCHLYSKYLYDLEKQNYERKVFSENVIIILSIFSLSVFTTFLIQYILVKNKHYEIGIKRAIGATKSDLLFEFQLKHCIAAFSGIIFGIVLAIFSVALFCLRGNLIYHINLFSLDIRRIAIYMTIYFGLSCLSSISSLFTGVSINISSVIVEER